MKRIISILLFLISIATNATTYYVSTTGNNGNPGTLAQPWLTWQYAFSSTNVQAGDTVFIRGGVYYTTIKTGSGIPLTRSGTSSDWIVYANYPGETPIIDFGNIVAGDIVNGGLRNDGIRSNGVSYVKLIGLTIRNVKQYFDRNYARAFYLRNGIVTLENCTAYNNWGHGFHSNHTAGETGIHRMINCDSYNNCDSISGNPLGVNAGATGAGFDAWAEGTDGQTHFINCRAWNNSDQGFSIGSESYVRCEGCWSFANNAYMQGGGAGFKEGWQAINVSFLRREMINNVAAFNDGYGFFTNEKGSAAPYYAVRSNHFNNIAYHNGYTVTSSGFGFIIQDTEQSNEIQQWRNYSNNIDYYNYRATPYTYGGYSGSNNSWDIPLTVTNADFVSVDSTGITAPRQLDGSLPDNDCYNYFLKIAEGSQLIDAGINVGLDYLYAAPDLGAFEYDGEASTATDILTFTLAEQTGAATINATNHTVAIEVAYTADVTNLTPTITLSYGATVIPASGTARDFTNPVPYTVTAGDGVTYQEWTVTVTQEAEPVTPVPTGGAIVKFNGKIVKR